MIVFDEVTMWVIFERPRDFPDSFVIQRQYVRVHAGKVIPWTHAPPGTALTADGYFAVERGCRLTDTLERARTSIPPDRRRLERLPDDDPAIVEVWV